MKWIFIAFFCIYFTLVVTEDSVQADSVVSLLLHKPNDQNNPANIQRTKRHEESVELETRGGWKRKQRYRGGGGGQKYPSYPVGFGGGPIGTGSQSSSNSQSSSWAQGGATGSQSQSNAQSGGFGHGGGLSGSLAGSSASSNSQSWGNGGISSSKSEASASAHSLGGHGGSSSGSNAQSSATGQGGFIFPGAYHGKK